MVVAPAGNGWQKVSKMVKLRPTIVAGEERQPLFPVCFAEDDGRRRRLFAGLIPVGKRESYMGASRRLIAGEPRANSDDNTTDPRMLLFWTQVTEPWKRLIEQAASARQMQQQPAADAPPSEDEAMTEPMKSRALKVAREQLQTASWYVLLDLANLLEKNTPDVWRGLLGQSPQSPLTSAQNTLINTLIGIGIDNGLAGSYALEFRLR